MGGLALKNTFTRRYSREEYDAIVPDIIEKAKQVFADATDSTFFESKESFGDADILCKIDEPITIDLYEWIKETYNSKEIIKNGNVYSFEYKELQVDFILTPKEKWETSKIYFSYNDIHNLIGKVARRFDLRWGFNGLIYKHYSENRKLGEIIVTKNHREALSFLGFDPNRYDLGFNNLEEIFEYVIESKYFNPEIFQLHTLNKVNRDRDKKRSTYNSFIEKIDPLRNKDYYYFHSEDKRVYLGLIDHYFPGFLKEYKKLIDLESRRIEASKKFNGNHVKEEFGVDGKELGLLMVTFNSWFKNSEEKEMYILNTPNEDIFKRLRLG